LEGVANRIIKFPKFSKILLINRSWFFDKRIPNVIIDVDWELAVKVALPEKVTRRAYKVPIWNLRQVSY
jgi:hypothetical protein